MTVMVTGIGFVGGYIVRELLESGEKVVLYGLLGGAGDPSDTTPPDYALIEQLVGGRLRDKVDIVIGDIVDIDSIIAAAVQYGVTKIVHLASTISAGSEANPPLAAHVNVVGFANVLETAKRLKFEKVVWASSCDVFGEKSADADGIVHDDSPYDPTYFYGATKVIGEQLAKSYAANHGLSITGLRLTRGYGFGEDIKAGRGGGSSWLVPLLREPAIGSGVEVTVAFGARRCDFLHLEDLAKASMKALDHTKPGTENYLIGGDYRLISEAYNFIRRLFPDAPINLQLEDSRLPPGASMAWSRKYDLTRAAYDIGHVSRISLEDGLLRTVNGYRGQAGLEAIPMPDGISTGLGSVGASS
jgi:UDP-glucose 4-epimerase